MAASSQLVSAQRCQQAAASMGGVRPRAAALPHSGIAVRPQRLGRYARTAPLCHASRDVKTRVAAPIAPPVETMCDDVEPPTFANMSYSEQYDVIFQEQPLRTRQLVPKPDKHAQSSVPGARKVPFSDVWGLPRVNEWLNRSWTSKDRTYAVFMVVMHSLALAAPFTFSWPNFWAFFASYIVTGCLGITLSYHRQLTHRSFETPKWLEYALAYCGVLSVQGDPIEWVSCHRYHHVHCDTPLDPHSPYEGFWWSHAGWLLDDKTTQARVHDRSNAKDLAKDPFYRHLEKHYSWHVVAQFAALYALGGMDAMIWAGALRLVFVYHITWFVNSAAHVWGTQTYNTGDLSRNNWWVGLLAFGEGWHNNHHAFESSARHGLEWWQFDLTWLLICGLRGLGLAHNIKLPSEKQKERLRLRPDTA